MLPDKALIFIFFLSDECRISTLILVCFQDCTHADVCLILLVILCCSVFSDVIILQKYSRCLGIITCWKQTFHTELKINHVTHIPSVMKSVCFQHAPFVKKKPPYGPSLLFLRL